MFSTSLPARILLSVLLAVGSVPATTPFPGEPARPTGQPAQLPQEPAQPSQEPAQPSQEPAQPSQEPAQDPAQILPPEGLERPGGGARLATGEALLLLTPGVLEVAKGETVRLAIVVLRARGVRSFPATVAYDPEVLELVDVQSGRAWETGAPPVLLHDESRAGEAILGISRLGPSAGTLSGTGELVELRFRARARGETEIRLDRFALLGNGSSVQPARARGARITVR